MALQQRQLLTDEFLSNFHDFPEQMTPLGQFVFLRTYSRFLTDSKRRETYKETCARATRYNIRLIIDHLTKIGYQIDWNKMELEAESLFVNMFNLKQFVSGRTLWCGGTKSVEKCSLSNFNCAALNITKWDDLCDLFYLLMVGTGVGFKVTRDLIEHLPKIRNNVKTIHSDYHPIPKSQRLEHTSLTLLDNGYAKIYVGDSKEGWVKSLKHYLDILTMPKYEYIHTIKLNYNSVRPVGEPLHTFGGTASGPVPLREMFDGISRTLKGELDTRIQPLIADSNGYVKVHPIHIMDIGNLIGQNVVVGGVRRTAEMCMFDSDDYEILFAKYCIFGMNQPDAFDHHVKLSKMLDNMGIKPKWFDQITEQFTKYGNVPPAGLNHRTLSNNSIIFSKRPNIEFLNLVIDILRYEGEPGLINLEEMKRRRPNAEVVNPCVTGDTIIMTNSGPMRVHDLIGKKFDIIINNKVISSTSEGFFKTGHKDVYTLKTKSGHSLRLTSDHKVLINRNGQELFVPAIELTRSDHIILNNVRDYCKWGNNSEVEKAKGWLLGMLLGDGHFTQNKDKNIAVIATWGINGKFLIDKAIEDLKLLGGPEQYNKLRTGCYHQAEDRYTVQSRQLAIIAEQYGIRTDKSIDRESIMPVSSSEFQIGFIGGIFDSDGTVIGNTKKGVSVRLSSSTIQHLELVQNMLMNLGINSTIYRNRRLCGARKLPDGHGEDKLYWCKSQHELCISRDNLRIFHQQIVFQEQSKEQKLDSILNSYKRSLYEDKFKSEFDSLTFDCTEDVYDCTIDDIHRFGANGIIVHNCGEVLLDSYQTCNLTTTNLKSFIIHRSDGTVTLDKNALIDAQKLSVRCGLRMTLVQLELPQWDIKQQRDRLIGVSLTGIKDTIDCLGYTRDQEIELMKLLGDVAREESIRYAKEIRVCAPLLVTTIKPEGTLSQVCGGVSQGLHLSHSPYFIRRIRINARDPLVPTIKKAGWIIHPEVGTSGSTEEEKINNARTLVVDFPVSSDATKTKYQSNINEQFDTYFTYQKYYADHNCSNTISVKPNEWSQLPRIIYDNWDKYIGITFIPLDGGSYQLAPYEECTKQTYEQLKHSMNPLDMDFLKICDQKLNLNSDGENSISIPTDEHNQSECANGICPLR